MGRLDIDSKQYFGIAKYFANAFNFLLYDGKQVIDPDELRELDASEIAVQKTDKLIPVVTIVIYTGTKPWDGPLSLHDMLEFKDKSLKAFVPDYKLNIISAADLDDSEFDKFHTEVGFALKALKHQDKDIDSVIEEQKHKKVSPETAFFLKAAANLDLDLEVENGGIDMCKSLERRSQKDKVIASIETYREVGTPEDDIIKRIMERFNVTKDYVLALLTPQPV